MLLNITNANSCALDNGVDDRLCQCYLCSGDKLASVSGGGTLAVLCKPVYLGLLTLLGLSRRRLQVQLSNMLLILSTQLTYYSYH